MNRAGAKARAFADKFLEPIAAALDRTGMFPAALVAELGQQGLLALPALAGGGWRAQVEMLEILAQACPAVAAIVAQHGLAAYAISHWGSEAQRVCFGVPLAAGQQLGALALQESGPALGLGPHPLRGGMGGGNITLNGRKTFVRNAGVADVYIGIATLGARGRICFIAEAASAGISVGTPYPTMGLRGCPVADVIFENVVLDNAHMLGTPETSDDILTALRGVAALGDAALTVGISSMAAHHAAAAARQRVQFGHPIADLQAIQTLLADIATDTHLARLGLRHAAALVDRGAPFAVAAAMVQSFTGRCGQKILIDAIQVEGGMGICEAVPPHVRGTLPLARLFRDIAGTTLRDIPGDFPETLIAAEL